jgi:cellulose biosynthesis protein BcsQ
MIAKLPGARQDGRGRSFKSLIRYILHDKNRASTSHRLAWAEAINCGLGSDLRRAWYEMMLTWENRSALKRADDAASGAYDHICIDLPGSREVTLFKALARSDLVIIPAQASEPDLREALVVAGDVKDVRETTGRDIPYRLLLTKVYPLRTRVTDFAYAELARLGLPLFRTALVERSAYREMFLNGQPPTVTEPGKGAGQEILALVAEIEAIVVGQLSEERKAG